MQLCAITDRKRLAGEDEGARRRHLRSLIIDWNEGGVDYIQLREKDLNASELGSIAEEILTGLDRSKSKLLLNMPASPPLLEAVAAVADGVHIPGQARRGTVGLVRQTFQAIGRPAIVSMACHSVEDAEIAQADGADLALFAPVFEKPAGEKSGGLAPGKGLNELERVCEAARDIPVFALGGVTVSNAPECLAAGAAGVAGIRLFMGRDWRLLTTAPG